MSMLTAADNSRYAKLTEDLDNDSMKGSNLYCKTRSKSYKLIVNYRQSKSIGIVCNDSEGVAFSHVKKRFLRRTIPMSSITIVTTRGNMPMNVHKKNHRSLTRKLMMV
jgi:hypothetical protein